MRFRPLRTMRQFLLAGGLSLATVACSWVFDLVLVNSSDQPLIVTLTPARGDSTDRECRCPDGFIHETVGTALAAEDRDLRHVYLDVGWHNRLSVRQDRVPHPIDNQADSCHHTPLCGSVRWRPICAGGILDASTPWALEVVGQKLQERWTPAGILNRVASAADRRRLAGRSTTAFGALSRSKVNAGPAKR